jgi:riboflavin synthase
MFSGIVQTQGKLIRKQAEKKHVTFTFEVKGWEKPIKRGESVSVNGVCLTAIGTPQKNQFSVQAVPETLNQTTLPHLRLKDPVNLERSLKWGDRIGGHFILGHVDGIGRILKKKKNAKSFLLEIEIPPSVYQNLVPKGSLAVDGISLTIQNISEHSVTIAVIPHTAKATILGRKKKGDLVNLEADVIAKHLAYLVRNSEVSSVP